MYLCPLTQKMFGKPCNATACPSHISNLNKSNVEITSTHNCLHADFHAAGFADRFSYAVEEQGFVGYRDLEYLSPFLHRNHLDLRSIYEEQLIILKNAIALFFHMSQEKVRMEEADLPLKIYSPDFIRSVSHILQIYFQALEPEDFNLATNIIFRNIEEKLFPPIELTEDQLESLRGLIHD